MSNIVKHSQLQEITNHLWGQVKTSVGEAVNDIALSGNRLTLTDLNGGTGELDLAPMVNKFFKEVALDSARQVLVLTKEDGSTEEIELATLFDAKFNTKLDKTEVGNSANLIPRLDSTGKLSTSILPDLALTEVFVVQDEAELLDANVQEGDVVVVVDEDNAVYMCKDASQIDKDDKFVALKVNDGTVKSINSKYADNTGSVTLEIGDIPQLEATLDEKLKTINGQTTIDGNIDITLSNTDTSLSILVGGHNIGSLNYMTAGEVEAIKNSLVW